MSTTHTPGRPSQQVSEPRRAHSAQDWTEVTVRSRDMYDKPRSEIVMRSRNGGGFIDIQIEEFVGISGRAKYTSIRLEREAVARLAELIAKATEGQQ